MQNEEMVSEECLNNTCCTRKVRRVGHRNYREISIAPNDATKFLSAVFAGVRTKGPIAEEQLGFREKRVVSLFLHPTIGISFRQKKMGSAAVLLLTTKKFARKCYTLSSWKMMLELEDNEYL